MTDLSLDIEPLGGALFRGQYWPLTQDEVASVEEVVGWKLDPDHVNFLLEYGVSGTAVPQCVPHELEGCIPFGAFYGASEDGTYSLLLGASEFLSGVPHLRIC